MNRFAFILIAILMSSSCRQESSLLKVGDFQFSAITELPTVIDESSGLEIAGPGEFWSHNDRNGNAELYRFNTSGNLTQTLSITNANNIDWEDLTSDEANNLYIGDFGNNDNDRQDLIIYKISDAALANNNSTIVADSITFSFSDQTAFPPPESERLFDVEAMFAQNAFLYLLTRDRSVPFQGLTKLYRLPNSKGQHTATLIGTYATDNEKSKGQITAADLSPDGQTMAMISSTTIWIFQNVAGENFFETDVMQLDLPIDLDIEGLVFGDDCTLYLSNEEDTDEAAILYQIKTCD